VQLLSARALSAFSADGPSPATSAACIPDSSINSIARGATYRFTSSAALPHFRETTMIFFSGWDILFVPAMAALGYAATFAVIFAAGLTPLLQNLALDLGFGVGGALGALLCRHWIVGIWQGLRHARLLGRRLAAAIVVVSSCLAPTVTLAQLFEPSALHREQWEKDQDPWQAIPDPSGHIVEHICSTGEGYIRVKDGYEFAPMTNPQTGEMKGYLRPRQVVKIYADKAAVSRGSCNVEYYYNGAGGIGWVPMSMLEPGRFRPRAKTQGGN
jgi:hypothetical protein